MTSQQLVFEGPVALVGGGQARDADIVAAIERSCAVVAADSGADWFTPGQAPRLDAVVGDMDSVSDLSGWRADPHCRVLHLAEQETTDLEKCLYSIDAPLFVGAGFMGPRFDHALAALNLLTKRADKRLLLISEDDVCFLAPRLWSIALADGARVSIVPLPHAQARASSGLKWPLDNLALELGGMIGVSNEATEKTVRVEFSAGRAAVILERRWLDAAIDSLLASAGN